MRETGKPKRGPAVDETQVGAAVVRRRKSDVVNLPEGIRTSKFGEPDRETLNFGGDSSAVPPVKRSEDTITILDKTRENRKRLAATGAFEPFISMDPDTDRFKIGEGSMSIEKPLTREDSEACLTAIEHVRVALGELGFSAELASLRVIQDYVITATTQAMVAARALDEAGDGIEAANAESNMDSLTGVLNRRGFDQRAGYLLEYSRRSGQPFSVIMFDADKFKNVNDTHGHDAGDTVLKELCRITSETLNSPIMKRGFGKDVEFVFGRFGREEFIIACNLSSAHAAMAAEYIRDQIAKKPLVHEDLSIPVTISLGVAETVNGEDLPGVRVMTDSSLYNSKRTGRNRVSVHVFDRITGISQSLPYEHFKASTEGDFTV